MDVGSTAELPSPPPFQAPASIPQLAPGHYGHPRCRAHASHNRWVLPRCAVMMRLSGRLRWMWQQAGHCPAARGSPAAVPLAVQTTRCASWGPCRLQNAASAAPTLSEAASWIRGAVVILVPCRPWPGPGTPQPYDNSTLRCAPCCTSSQTRKVGAAVPALDQQPRGRSSWP